MGDNKSLYSEYLRVSLNLRYCDANEQNLIRRVKPSVGRKKLSIA
jgi:hypothetical protein